MMALKPLSLPIVLPSRQLATFLSPKTGCRLGLSASVLVLTHRACSICDQCSSSVQKYFSYGKIVVGGHFQTSAKSSKCEDIVSQIGSSEAPGLVQWV